jgi:uncharacterized membrane protein YraQ (UPF0718 family)
MSFVKAIKKNKLLFLVASVYIILFVFMPQKAFESVGNSMYYVKEMLQIMPVIFILTSLIEAWVPRKTIIKSFGEDSGFKGSIFSFLLGSFSAGPIYAAFPVCKMLLQKGASISNIVIILSAWAVIKVPMLANEAKFLGPKFMGIRWVLTTISIFIMAHLVSLLVKKSDLPIEDEKVETEGNILEVKGQYCIGCGVCTKICPDNFALVDGISKATTKEITPEIKDNIKMVIERCPAKAIYLK